MNIGQLQLSDLDQSYYCVVQLRHQSPGVMHSVILRPDKVKQTKRQCSMGHYHDSGVIVLGETPGDQFTGWQHPENIFVVAVLGKAVEKDSKWICVPIE